MEAASEIPSPCTGVCRLDAAEVCVGCGRTLAEIAAWSESDTAQKLDIRARAAQRVAQSASLLTSSGK
ncbi:MAG: DUF1289 domain-containing protein [Nevskiales bacterium]